MERITQRLIIRLNNALGISVIHSALYKQGEIASDYEGRVISCDW